jgi:hypothetical protein
MTELLSAPVKLADGVPYRSGLSERFYPAALQDRSASDPRWTVIECQVVSFAVPLSKCTQLPIADADERRIHAVRCANIHLSASNPTDCHGPDRRLPRAQGLPFGASASGVMRRTSRIAARPREDMINNHHCRCGPVLSTSSWLR